MIDLKRASVDLGDPLWRSINEGMNAGVLVIDLGSRQRIRINGDLTQPSKDTLHLAVRESFPNCPKYITRRIVKTVEILPASEVKTAEGTLLGPHQKATVTAADVFFVGTAHPERGFDASHRGGAPGFIEVVDDNSLRIPDYLGNSMFSTLGNLAVDPRASLTLPDFARGIVLRLSGTAKTLWNQTDEGHVSGGTHRFLEFFIERWSEQKLPPGVYTEFVDYSRYNPVLQSTF